MNLERKKILYVITKSNFGGAQRYVYDLATHLSKERYDVSIVCGGSGLLVERLKTHTIRTIEVKNFQRDVSPMNDVRAFFELIALYRRERPDIVHLNSAKAVTMGALAARIARVPRIISTIHGWASNEPRPWWQRTLIRTIERVGIALTHETIVVCAHDHRLGTVVIHNGIETPPFLSREEARRTLSLPTDAFVVGTIAELHKNKNIGMLIDAFAETHITNATLAIIGDGEERAPLEARAQACTAAGDIHFYGFLPEAHMLMRAFDVFVLPSQKEGLPYVLLEAGTASLPVIATRIGGIPEIITDGVSGTLISSGEVDALSRAVAAYHQNLDRSHAHGRALSKHVASSFSLQYMIEKTTEEY